MIPLQLEQVIPGAALRLCRPALPTKTSRLEWRFGRGRDRAPGRVVETNGARARGKGSARPRPMIRSTRNLSEESGLVPEEPRGSIGRKLCSRRPKTAAPPTGLAIGSVDGNPRSPRDGPERPFPRYQEPRGEGPQPNIGRPGPHRRRRPERFPSEPMAQAIRPMRAMGWEPSAGGSRGLGRLGDPSSGRPEARLRTHDPRAGRAAVLGDAAPRGRRNRPTSPSGAGSRSSVEVRVDRPTGGATVVAAYGPALPPPSPCRRCDVSIPNEARAEGAFCPITRNPGPFLRAKDTVTPRRETG